MLVLTEAAAEVVKPVTSTPQTPDGMGLRIVSLRGNRKPGTVKAAAASVRVRERPGYRGSGSTRVP